ncbi:MAG: hypothetical protein U5N85_15325 [Arcicella sp.]|nr:hypothetical protein [Arcicella sp.]
MENNKEDILKKILQDTFSDYEPEPSDASWENIFSAIQPNQPTFWGKSKPWIISVIVGIIGLGLWYSFPKAEANYEEIALKTGESVNATKTQSDESQTEKVLSPLLMLNGIEQTKKSDGSLLVKIPTRAESVSSPKTQSDESQTEKVLSPLLMLNGIEQTKKSDGSLLVKETPTRAEIAGKSDGSLLVKETPIRAEIAGKSDGSLLVKKTPTKAGIAEKSDGSLLVKKTPTRAGIIVKNNTPKAEGANHSIVEKQSDESVVDVNLTASTSERMETLIANEQKQQSDDSQTASEDVNGQVEITATSKQKQQLDDSQTEKTQNTIIEQVRYIRPMESLKNKDFTLAKIALNAPTITPVITPNREAKPVRQHTYLSMSITPIQTYRILTINNNKVQKVQTNNLFDSERNGWQFDLGITKPIGKLWNFRTNLSYLRMRQWSQYQVGTDELILRNTNYGSRNPSQNASAELEVVGRTVTESKSLHMVGLKMDVQKFFKITPKNRYFLSTGTQLMYENSPKQSNLFLNVSAGFQHIVSQTTFITIEPTASYSLNNFNDSKSLLQANGYNLGLKMGVSFKVK